nr:hypothetical protein [Mycobacterium sp.]
MDLAILLPVVIGVVVGLVMNARAEKRRPGTFVGSAIAGAIGGGFISLVLFGSVPWLSTVGGIWLRLTGFLAATVLGAVFVGNLVGRKLKTKAADAEPAAETAAGGTIDGAPIFPITGHSHPTQPPSPDSTP